MLFDGLTSLCQRGGLVGVIGPNGAGKTTLFRLIERQESLTTGRAQDRRDSDIAYSDHRARSTASARYEEIAGGQETIAVGKREIIHARTARALDSKARISKSSSATCPAARRSRLHLAKTLMAGGKSLDAGRADQLSRRRHAACAGVSATRLRRGRGDHYARSWFSIASRRNILAFEGRIGGRLVRRHYQA